MIERLITFFKQPKEATNGQVPEGICPNCWGYHEYDQTIREAYQDQQVDINNKKANHSFIQNFVVNHLDGITLKEKEEGAQCPACKTNF